MLTAALPSLSVIIPCYNASRSVGEAVQSVLDQLTPGIDCIVVDDGSTDASAEVVRARFGEAVRLIRQTNEGVAAARNRGFAAARGTLVAWLDADDVLTPRTLDERRAAFAHDPDLDMLVGQVRNLDVDTGVENVMPQRCDADYLVRDLLHLTNLPHTNVLTFRAAAVRRIGSYDGTLPIVDDYDFWLRAWQELRWRFVRQEYATHREGAFASLSKSRGKVFHYEQIGRVLVKHRAMVRALSESDRAWRRAYAAYASGFARLHLRQGNKRAARRWAVRAVLMSPLAIDAPTRQYLLQSTLPDRVYSAARSARVRLGWR